MSNIPSAGLPHDASARNRLLIVDVIVEGEPAVCAITRQVAETEGFDIFLASDGQGFRLAYSVFRPSAVFLDLEMPGEDGIGMLRYLADQRFEGQIIIASGVGVNVLRTARQLAVSYGLRKVETLQKPFLLWQLDAVLRKVLGSGRLITERDLAEAISDRSLVLHYQPKVALDASCHLAVDSVEALVRWRHPGLGLVSPGDFIPLAERTGLIAPLTDLVLEMALEQGRAWRENGIPVAVAVNYSAPLLSDTEIPDRLADLLAEHGLPPSRLILEVTESGLAENAREMMEVLTRLRLKGIRLSIDDFGTGYSSLAQLHRMPFSELKIDSSFVSELCDQEETRVVVRSFVELAGKLGMTTCAEGVENEETLNILRLMGCDEAQGYLLGPPVAADEMTRIVEAADHQPIEDSIADSSTRNLPSGSPISRGNRGARAGARSDVAPADD